MLGIFSIDFATLSIQGETAKASSPTIDVFLKGNLYLPRHEQSRLLEEIANSGVSSSVAKALPGQFVLVVHHKQSHRIDIVRDHIGQQPLYYCREGRRLLFASSVKELRSTSDRSWSLDAQGMVDYFALKYTIPGSTLFAEISEQEPGTIISFTDGAFGGEQFYLERVPGTPIDDENDDDDCIGRFKSEFAKSFERVCLDSSSRRIGILSSGGIDSSMLVGACRRMTQERVPTFYVGCHGYKNDKAKDAELVSRLYGTEHTNFYLDGAAFATGLLQTIAVNEFPIDSPSAVLRNHLYSSISGEVDVLLSGEGADCLYTGYYIFDLLYRFYAKSASRRMIASILRLMPLSIVPGDRGRKLQLVKQSIVRPPHEYFLEYDTVVVNNRERLSAMLETYEESRYLPGFKRILSGYGKHDILNRILSIYQSSYLSGNLATLAKFDDAYGLQHRHPFICDPMKEAFDKVSWSRKVGRFRRKQLVVEMAREYLPKSFFDAPKEGFGVPVAEWFRDPAGLGQFVDLLSSQSFRERGLFKKNYIDTLLSRYQKDRLGEAMYEEVLWPLINFELWASRFLDRKGSE